MVGKVTFFASYALIMKELQNTELLLIQMIYSINLREGRIRDKKSIEKIYTQGLKDYLSMLIKKVKDHSSESNDLMDPEIIEKAQLIVKLRNHFAHNFFKEFSIFEDQELIISLLEGNKFAYNQITNFNTLLQNKLKTYLNSMNFPENEIEAMTSISRENWEILEHI